MIELFINDALESLTKNFDGEQLRLIRDVLSQVGTKYTIKKKATSIVKYNNCIPQCLNAYLVTKKMEGVTSGTLKNYEYIIKTFFNTAHKTIDKITSNDIRAFLYIYQSEKEITNRSLDKKRAQLCTFFKWCAAEGYVKTDPSVNIKPIKYEIKQRGHLSELEMEQLRQACKSERDKAIIEVLYSTGCRVSELIGMKKSDIKLDLNEVEVFGKGKKYRNVYLNAKSLLAIKNYLKVRTDNNESLFVRTRNPYPTLTVKGIEEIVERLGKAAGIKQKVYPHLIRHTTATHGLARGMDVTQVQKMLGHSNVATTMIYAEVADNTVKVNHNKCFN